MFHASLAHDPYSLPPRGIITLIIRLLELYLEFCIFLRSGQRYLPVHPCLFKALGNFLARFAGDAQQCEHSWPEPYVIRWIHVNRFNRFLDISTWQPGFVCIIISASFLNVSQCFFDGSHCAGVAGDLLCVIFQWNLVARSCKGFGWWGSSKGYGSKKDTQKALLLVKGKINQNLWFLGVFFLTHSQKIRDDKSTTRRQHWLIDQLTGKFVNLLSFFCMFLSHVMISVFQKSGWTTWNPQSISQDALLCTRKRCRTFCSGSARVARNKHETKDLWDPHIHLEHHGA